MRRISIALMVWVLCSSWAGAAQIVEFSPKGTVATVQSIKLALDSPAVSFGDAQSAAPVDVVCNDPAVTGQGRWLDERRWTYEFTVAPGPGVRCTVDARKEFRTLSNEPITGKTRFSFQTGGPRVVDSRPWDSTIDEDQVFVLRFNGPVDTDSVLAGSRCLVEGLGEAVPLRLITGDTRQDILKAAYLEEGVAAATQVVQCKRRLPAEAKVQLSVGPGITTPAAVGRDPMASTKPDVFNYTVRKPFKANFTCLRENSSMPCTPVAPVAVEFTAPISRLDAAGIRLKTPAGERPPTMSEDDTYLGPTARVQFDGPFAELSTLTLSLPQGLKDEAGRDLVNADEFPLAVPMAGYPPLVKFAAAPFGVVERFAEAQPGANDADVQASVPLTVRNVEAGLRTTELTVSAGKVSDYVAKEDAEVLRWYARVRRLENGRWTAAQLEDIMADRQPRQDDKPPKDTRAFSALKGRSDVRELSLPGLAEGDVRPFEVVGVPIEQPGFHVLEVTSARLGQALVESREPMVVRSTVLVTNLAVHVKKGRDDVLAWVTTLDEGVVVPNADITVLSCAGAVLARGRTGDDGIWHYRQGVDAPDYCEGTGLSGTYVSARIPADHPQARGKADFSFVFSDWNRGIESWRFNVPTDTSAKPTMVTHTVFDRTLLRAGETVSMKHFARIQTRDGLALPDPATGLPDRLIIEHQGSDQRYEQSVSWQKTPSGGMSASGHFDIARTARLGTYTVRLTDADGTWYGMNEFRVDEFKLPLLAGTLQISSGGEHGAVVAPRSLSADVQISYVSGGAARRLPVQLSAVLRDRHINFPGYDDYSFDAPAEPALGEDATTPSSDDTEDDAKQILFLDKKGVVLDEAGSARVEVDTVPPIDGPRTMLFEASFSDPNGQIQTLAQSVPVWPAHVQAGLRAGDWVRAGDLARFDALALSPDGRPQSGVAMQVRAIAKTTYSTRKRLVGGFYSYDNHTETRDLGTICEGTTAANGVMACSATLAQSGSIEVVAVATDGQGHVSRAASSIWVTGSDELWFGGENDDRIDIIPAKKVWAPGETATFQVRMPFRHATALVAIEREGVLETRVIELSGKDPGFSIPIREAWGPNVYVSVLALRGRLHAVPWYSFFASGWKSPASWHDAFMAARKEYVAPTALIDLAKPAFRYGLTEIHVTDRQDQLDVKVSTDKTRYQLRERAEVSIAVTLPDGAPAAHGTVAFAAVDQALLELAPNTSWDLLNAMRQFRSYGVETATAQMEVVGRRHYGRKAMPAGGGGGKSPTRELLDTLLLWQPSIQLDDQGKARISVPLNDAITQFKLIAIADFGAGRFGTGSAQIVSSQDLQVIPGLPALIREGDRYSATVTVRNATDRAMQLAVGASYAGKGVMARALEEQALMLDPGSAHQLSWDVVAPENTLLESGTALKWIVEARERPESGAPDRGKELASDRLVYEQVLVPAVPVEVRQATMVAVDASAPLRLAVSPPAGALTNAAGIVRGGLNVHAQSSLAGGLPGVQAWFADYPYTCFEQTASRAMALRDSSQWQQLMRRLPDYLDEDGLAGYFPGAAQGNEVLTAYLLSATHEAQSLGLPFVIPEASRKAMTRGLLGFAQGKLVRHRWAPQRDLDVRKLLVLEALSRQGLVKPRMLSAIAIDPDAWPTSALIDWMAILQRVPGIPDHNARMKQVRQLLLARMAARGTELAFNEDARNDSWWLMTGPEANQARLILTAAGQTPWRDDMPRLAAGLLGMQRHGAWRTTTGNLLGSLAMEKFAQHYEKEPVSGQMKVQRMPDGVLHTFDWARNTAHEPVSEHDVLLNWTQGTGGVLSVEQQGPGRPWVTIRSLAAVPSTTPIAAGYSLERRVTPVSQAVPGRWSQGDVYRVTLRVDAASSTTWAVLTDPIPAGATILGGGLGRDSSIASGAKAEQDDGRRPAFIERSFASYRAYYDYLPAGKYTLEYTVRLNTAGEFHLPPTRIEAMYQPDVHGELPGAGRMSVSNAKTAH